MTFPQAVIPQQELSTNYYYGGGQSIHTATPYSPISKNTCKNQQLWFCKAIHRGMASQGLKACTTLVQTSAHLNWAQVLSQLSAPGQISQ